MEVVIAFFGVCLVVAPWIVGYAYGAAFSAAAVWTSVILGVIVLAVAAYRVYAKDRSPWEAWISAACGVLAIIAPFVFGYSERALWTSIILGAVIVVLAVIQLFATPRTHGIGTPTPHAT